MLKLFAPGRRSRRETPPVLRPEDQFAPAPANPNRCEHCLAAEGSHVPAWEFADTGRCGACGKTDEVFDLPLLAYYFTRGIEAPRNVGGMPHSPLPRLRSPFLPGLADRRSWAQVDEAIGRLDAGSRIEVGPAR